jgi:hypothetical protein
MLVGLPGAGKTFWAENWAKKYPEKNFNIMVSIFLFFESFSSF